MALDGPVFVAGSTTMKGAAIVSRLRARGVGEIVGLGSEEPDLLNPAAVDRFFAAVAPKTVFVAAGRHAGIGGNQRYPADLMIDNLLVAASVIPAAARHRSSRLLYLASSCAYPKLAPQPFETASLWTGPLEETSAAYAVAKLAGMTLADAYRRQQGSAFITGIAADAFGPGDDFSPDNSHVVGALMRRMHEARESGLPRVEIWGTGRPRREFIYIDDLADACIFAIERHDQAEPLNLGTGVTTSIAELAEEMRKVVGYRGDLQFDATRPDGMPLKGLDSKRLHEMGWRPAWSLRAGLAETYRWFCTQDMTTRTPARG